MQAGGLGVRKHMPVETGKGLWVSSRGPETKWEVVGRADTACPAREGEGGQEPGPTTKVSFHSKGRQHIGKQNPRGLEATSWEELWKAAQS